MVTLIELMCISIAIANAEGTVKGFTATDAYMGHVDPAVYTLGIDRKDNYGMFSISSTKYKLSTELDYLQQLGQFLNSLPNEYSSWVLLNIADLYVQSPAATKGWSDTKSVGLGFLYLLKSYKGPNVDEISEQDLKDIAEIRAKSFVNVDGVNEGFMSFDNLYLDQLRRVESLYNTMKHQFTP